MCAWGYTAIIVYPVEFKGHGNSFHGKGGRGSKISQLRQSLHLLLSMCSSADDGVIQDLHDQGAIPIMLSKWPPLHKPTPHCVYVYACDNRPAQTLHCLGSY